MRGAIIPDKCPNCGISWSLDWVTHGSADHVFAGGPTGRVPIHFSSSYRQIICRRCGYALIAPNLPTAEQETLT